MKITKANARKQLQSLRDHFLLTSRNETIRCEFGGLIEDMYLADFLEQSEYHLLMSEVY